MRLPERVVKEISRKIVENITGKKLITCKVDEKVIFGIVKEVFLQDLGKEDELDREVQEILEKHLKGMDRSKIDIQKMTQMIKKQLIKDRNLVI